LAYPTALFQSMKSWIDRTYAVSGDPSSDCQVGERRGEDACGENRGCGE
jgi:hypothetical protein